MKYDLSSPEEIQEQEMTNIEKTAEVFPLVWTEDVERLAQWAMDALDLKESWRAPGEDGTIEHLELHWFSGKISINIKGSQYAHTGPCGISLRIDDKETVDSLFRRAKDYGANITQDVMDSPIAYSFTATDPDGNQWWVNAENGMLDQLRKN